MHRRGIDQPEYPLGGLRIEFTLRAVYVAQTVLALPYIVALVPAAIQGLPPQILGQARLLGASRLQVAALALWEARLGVLAAVIAALGSGLSEVGAVTIVGGCQGSSASNDMTLGCMIIPAVKTNADDGISGAIGAGMVLLGLVLLMIGALTIIQQRGRHGGRSRRGRVRTHGRGRRGSPPARNSPEPAGA